MAQRKNLQISRRGNPAWHTGARHNSTPTQTITTQMLTFLSLLTFIGAALGTLSLLFSFMGSAPQAAAGAAAAVALVVIPYCLAKLVWMSEQRTDTKAILDASKAQRQPAVVLPTLTDRVE